MGISNVSNGLRGGICTSTTRPTAPYEGQMIYETDTNRLVIYDGSSWVYIADTDTPPASELIKVQTIGSAVTSVTVSNVFSSAYDNYIITVAGGSGSTGSAILNLKLGSTTTGYYNALQYIAYNSTPQATGVANSGPWDYVGSAGTDGIRVHITLLSPYLSKITSCHSLVTHMGDWSGTQAGFLNNVTSYTDFTLSANVGTMTGGTIRVYGYRNSI